MHFTKTAKTFSDQITLLEGRGLKIGNKTTAIRHLSNISYYRLSAYLLSFQKFNDPNHTYMPWASFDRVITLYVYDRELRSILLDAIERIEVAFRCRLVYEYCHLHGNNWYENSGLFLRNHQQFMILVNKELKNTKELFIKHYFNKYTHPQNPPAWMAMEVLSFGQISTMYKNLKNDPAKKAVAHHFGVSPTILQSWMEHLAYVRNLCAHHSRVWNRTMTVTATFPSVTTDRWIASAPAKHDKPYLTLCIRAYLTQRVTNNSPFFGKLRTLIYRFPEVDQFAAGFPLNWQSHPFWSSLYVPLTHRFRVLLFILRNQIKPRFR
jgi:abortive infection bacteriophage resistance protein